MLGQPQTGPSLLRPKTDMTEAEPRPTGIEASSAPQVQQFVADQARARSSALALKAGAEELTFGELDAQSNQLARHLKSLGVGPDKLVGLGVQRSPAFVMAALAVLKAGGAYVPLDSSLPESRLNFMLRDSGIGVLITRGDARLPSSGWREVDLVKDAAEIARHSSTPFQAPVSGDNLAYVIYTSGSTGQPKGVEITHRGLSNLVAWHDRAFGVTEADRASHQAAIGFDAAVWEVWPYLAVGASIHIPDDNLRNDPAALRDWLVAQKISITFLATPMAERMLRLEWPSSTALRILLTGADTLHQRPSIRVPFQLINNYGPTECTVVATSGVVSAETANSLPSIGRPIDNVRAYILDEQMRPVPSGEMGELFVAGAGIARGYRNLPDMTAQKFVPDPSVPGDQMYRTGDRARFLETGEIEFLGRIDEQIKIRGFRIEPSEIVRALDEHPYVTASAVIAADSQTQEKRLIAYVVTSSNTVTASALREHLSKQVPDYMVPAAFVRVESLPQTVNGKLDRAALAQPNQQNILQDEAFVSPQGLIEQRLAPIIASLLHVERIGSNDNFFFLGGHSLLGTQLLTKISEAFGVELTLLQLFDHPTLAEMSRGIEKLILAKLDAASDAGNQRELSGQKTV